MAVHEHHSNDSGWTWKDAVVIALVALSWLTVSGVALLPR